MLQLALLLDQIKIYLHGKEAIDIREEWGNRGCLFSHTPKKVESGREIFQENQKLICATKKYGKLKK